VAAYRQAVRLDPTYAGALTNLGGALSARGEVGEAVAAYRQAVCLDGGNAIPYGALGQALLRQGEFAEAEAATRRCLDLLPPDHPFRKAAAQQLRRCESRLALEGRLAAVLRGDARPAGAAERLALAQLCRRYKRLYAAAARFYAEAFAEEPRLADDLRAGHRYDAACAAALAAAGQGRDAAGADDRERARLRGQALGWLRADLAARAALLDRGPAQARPEVRRALRQWQSSPDLAGLRDPEGLGKLPAAERQGWRRFWDEVGRLHSSGGAG
jgi:tetratricopeptide (TPR) repeat protein